MNDFFTVLTDVMLWGSIVLLGSLAVLEHRLSLSGISHVLAQIVMLLIVFGWASIWFALGQNHRIATWSGAKDEMKAHPTHLVDTNLSKDDAFVAKGLSITCQIETDSNHEVKQRIYGSNN